MILHEDQVAEVNVRCVEWLECTDEQVVGRAVTEVFGKSTEPGAVQATLTGRSARAHVQIPSVTGERTLELTVLDLDAESRLLILTDVTSFHHARNELSQKRATLDESLNGYDIVDADGELVYVNPAYLKMWGYDSIDEIRGMSPSQHCADPQMPAKIIAEVEKHGSSTFEFEARRKDGSTFDVLMSVHVSHDEQGNKIYVGTSLDVSELKRLQVEVFQLQKMEAVGGLAASIAHDFNNMLLPMLGFSELLLDAPDLSGGYRRQIEQIHLAAEHCRDLTAQLLAFSRKQVLEPRPTDLRHAVAEVENLIRRMLRENIRLTVNLGGDFEEDHCRVMVDPRQLHHLLINLATNAQDAMPKGGQLSITVHKQGPDGFGELIVTDTGEGMNEETLSRVFEPFFTTKGPLGTGLGLPSVQGIVEQHGGTILVDSVPDEGTTFRVRLPLTDATPSKKPERLPVRPAAKEHVVLLVEDNDLVRDLVREVLERSGYVVHAKDSGAAAQEWLSDPERTVDLLLSDLIMTDMSGCELANAVSAARPNLPVLYMSGYTDDLLDHDGIAVATEVDLLRKPFSTQELLKRVEMALSR